MKKFIEYFLPLVLVMDMCNAQGWRKLYLPEIDSTAHTIQFVDSLNGWVLAERQLFITTDGGETWNRSVYPANLRLLNGKLENSQIGFVVVTDKDPKYDYIQPIGYSFNYIVKIWNKVFQTKHPIAYLVSAIIDDSYKMFLGWSSINFKYYLWRINNKQSNYDSTLLPYGYPFPVGNWAYSSIGFRDTSVGYITASQALAPGLLPWGLILKTTDGGKSWVDDTVMYAAGFYEIEFTDSLRGYITAEMNYDYDPTFGRWTWSNALRYTTNGGMSWSYIYHIPARKGWFLNDTTFLALSTYGVFFRSTLNAMNASSQMIFNKVPIVDFCSLNDQDIWLLSDDGMTIYKWDPLLSTTELDMTLAEAPTLSQNYPNPFHAFTSVDISLPTQAYIRIDLYDLLGRKIRTLVDTEYREGVHTVSFDMTNIAAGLYCCQMIVNDMQESLTAISKWMSVQ